MASNSSRACCVCGKNASTRCPTCGQAGFDLFFCSKEHQKLVWPVHKMVCGERSKPFRWPRLSQAETQQAMWQGLNAIDPSKGSQLGDLIKDTYGLEDKYLVPLVLCLQINSASPLHPDFIDDALCLVRTGEEERLKRYPDTVEAALRSAAAMSFRSFAQAKGAPVEVPSKWGGPGPVDMSKLPSSRQLPAWYDRVHHLLLVYVALDLHATLLRDKPETKSGWPEAEGLAAQAWWALDAVVQSEVKETHPDIASEFGAFRELLRRIPPKA
ncbi:hypothetical protein JCM8097_002070 [Rhodosporidiobolus ruineniae]